MGFGPPSRCKCLYIDSGLDPLSVANVYEKGFGPLNVANVYMYRVLDPRSLANVYENGF